MRRYCSESSTESTAAQRRRSSIHNPMIMVNAPSPMPNSPEDCAACCAPSASGRTSCVTTSESIASMKVTNLTDESMGLCVLCAITIPRIAIKKNPQLTQQTVKSLKEAFWKLYETKPIEKISVRQITELAGYNHATFYLYFSSVRDVRDQIEDDLIAQRDLILKQCMHDGTLEMGQHVGSRAVFCGRHRRHRSLIFMPHACAAAASAASFFSARSRALLRDSMMRLPSSPCQEKKP